LPLPSRAVPIKIRRFSAKGKTYKAIAAELYISENTIGSHARNIYVKAGVTNRAELMNSHY